MINDLRLQHYRSYPEAVFEFSPGVNIIVGPNASGKTNLLEAVLVIASGSSYRVKDVELISFAQPWARLEADTAEGERKVTIERDQTRIDSGTVKKNYTIGGVKLSRLTLPKKIPVVVFEPEHLQLLHRGPEMRRDYLDNLLEQTVASYPKLRRDYRRTLAQRNALLKQPSAPPPSQIFAWDVRISELGSAITAHRSRLVDVINETLQTMYQQIATSDAQVALRYDSDANPENYSSEALKLLEASLQKDRMRGFTSVGPHRHELTILLNNHPAASTASRGEGRTLLLALKLVELAIIEQQRGKKPLLLLDDVFSELDGARRKALTRYLRDYQTFITTTDADIVVQNFMEDCNVIPLSQRAN